MKHKYRAWDGSRMTTYGIMFNSITGELETAANMPLMQCTGLTNAAGVEWWEGDIVEYDGHVCEIVFYNGSFCRKWLSRYDGEIYYYYTVIDNHDLLNFGVIGNIYENPELIKVKE